MIQKIQAPQSTPIYYSTKKTTQIQKPFFFWLLLFIINSMFYLILVFFAKLCNLYPIQYSSSWTSFLCPRNTKLHDCINEKNNRQFFRFFWAGTKNKICVSLVYSGNEMKFFFSFPLYTRETQISFFVPVFEWESWGFVGFSNRLKRADSIRDQVWNFPEETNKFVRFFNYNFLPKWWFESSMVITRVTWCKNLINCRVFLAMFQTWGFAYFL